MRFSIRSTSLFLMIIVGLFLSSCAGVPPACTPETLSAPENFSPAGHEIVLDYEPLFVWSYTGDCETSGWLAEVTTYGGYAYGVTQSSEVVGGVITNTVFSTALEPATQYEWRVAGKSGVEIGSYSSSTSFWTGPICPTLSMNPPVQSGPISSAIISNEFPPLSWHYPDGCIPEETLLQLDVDPSFLGPNLVAGLGTPRIGQIPLAALTDCTDYYWRVRSENPDGTSAWSPTWTFSTDFVASCAPPPICATESLIAPIPNYPASGDIVLDLNTLFLWSYPEACTPEGYRLDVTTYGGYDYGTTHSGGTGNPSTSWAIGAPMEPATQYEWKVTGINNITLGPESASIPFWTGPICTTLSMAAPNQITPADGSTVANPFPPMGWQYPDACIPELTRLQLATDMAFTAPLALDSLGSTRIGQIPANALEDCTTYYWRVQSENPDGTGPWSSIWSFATDFEDACPAAGGGEPMAYAPKNITCREGDNSVFEPLGFFLEGQSAMILGRNFDGSWLLLPMGTYGEDCWVATYLVELRGDVSLDAVRVMPSIPTPIPVPTSTPTHVPNSGAPPTPTPVRASGAKVTNVRASVKPAQFKGTCPYTFYFSAEITTNGAGDVQYRWLRSDGGKAPVQTITFKAAGTQTVTTTWTLGALGKSYNDFWQAVAIISPNSRTSNHATFTLSCGR